METSLISNAEDVVEQLYPYRVEPLRPALILTGVEAVFALIIPNVAWREFVLLWTSGPLLYILLQIARRGCGVTVYTDRVAMQSSLSRRVTSVPFDHLLGQWVTPNQRLALAFNQPRPMITGDPDPRPPRLRLYVTATLADPAALVKSLPVTNKLTPEQVRKLFRMRRTRRLFFLIFALAIGFPLLILLVLRFMSSIGIGGAL